METLSQAKFVVFDRREPLTQGVFEVSGIHHNEIEEEKLFGICGIGRMCFFSRPSAKVCRGHTEKKLTEAV